MAKSLLVYDISGYPEEGGGLYAEDFEFGSEMSSRVNVLAKLHTNKFSIKYAGRLTDEVEYVPVEKIIEYKPKKK